MSDNQDIVRGLEQDAQIITERIPDTMVAKKLAEFRARLRKFIEDFDYSQAKLARQVGVPSPDQQLSQRQVQG